MENGIVYTLAMRHVKEGREEEFVRAWREYLADSFGPWMSLEDIRRMRSNPHMAAIMGRLEVLCEEIMPGNFQEAMTLP